MKPFILLLFGIISCSALQAQQEMEIRTDGIVVPRTTTGAVIAPVEGMLIYDTATDRFKYYDGSMWSTIGVGATNSDWTSISGIPQGFADNTDDVIDGDASATNELQTLTKSGNQVSLSNSGGSFTDEVDDADADPANELQTLFKTRNEVTLSNGGGSFTDEVNDADPDPSNEIQDLAIEENSLILSKSSSNVPFSDITNWKKDGAHATISGGIKIGSVPDTKKEEGMIRYNPSTMDFEGFGGGAWKSLTGLPSPPPPPTYAVGDYAEGGVVFWVAPDGREIKVIYVGELGVSAWSNVTNALAGAFSNTDGDFNSTAIINQSGHSSSAAQRCTDLIYSGHNDWYLPSINDLSILFDVRATINPTINSYGGDDYAINTYYWSSTELDATHAYYFYTTLNNTVVPRINDTNKTASTGRHIRAIRKIVY